MSEEMQTEIEKRIEEYISKLGMTHDRNNNPNVISPSSIVLGAKFILELPEFKEFFELSDDLREELENYWGGYSGEVEWIKSLSKLRVLGIVKEGGK